MGNFSRDTFKLTNIMHQLITGAPVLNPAHYVGIRLQQGVPVLDADWNELEDIRRFDIQTCLQYFYGNGIPIGNNGFHIGPVTQDNNFKIETGIALVEGMLVINPHQNLTYSDQEALLSLSLPMLDPPIAGIRSDLVYLDVWEEEVYKNGPTGFDDRLINPLIGIETCTRIERRWVVRLAEGVTDLTDITREARHAYMALALLKRVEGESRILVHRFTDLRRIDLNVSKYLKVPVHVERGTDIVDSQKMAQLLEDLRTIILARLENKLLFVNSVMDHDRTVVYFAVQYIAQVCSTGALQAKTNNITNADALEVLSTLLAAQDTFLNQLAQHGDSGSALTNFITEFRRFLTGGTGVPGIQIPLTEKDLIGAFKGQQVLNAFLSAAVDTLPEGEVLVQYLSVSPFVPLVAGQPFQFTVEFTSGVTSNQSSEIFDISVELSSALWNVDRTTDEITLDNLGGKGTHVFTVTPNAANVQCQFKVVAQARRNTTIVSKQPGLTLQIGQRPAVGAKLLYAGPPLDVNGRIQLSNAALTSGLGTAISFALNNRTDQSHTYRLRWNINLQVGSETGWLPLESSPQENNFIVAANSIGPAPLSISGPTGGNVVGNIGTLRNTLFSIDGADLILAEQEILNIDFIVV